MFPTTLRHILAPTDFSVHSERALEAALTLARPARARVTLLHVVASSPDAGYGGVGLGDLLAALELAARERLERRLDSIDVPCDALVTIGSPFEQILSFIDQQAPDLVVMSTHGRTGLRHLMMGSVAERVVQRSACPVLALPRPRS